MKKKFLLYALGAIAILIAGALTFGFLVILPADIRSDCNQEALDYISYRAKNRAFYDREDRDADYKFQYQSCLRGNGFENL